MTTAEALSRFLVEKGVAGEGDANADPYADPWFYIELRGRKVPFFPKAGFRGGLPAHDAHHMLNDYDTSWVGECETAAWELASGGCGPHVAYWGDRIFFLGIALVIAPVRTTRAWRRGLRQRNLYRMDPDRLLSMDVEAVREFIARQPLRARLMERGGTWRLIGEANRELSPGPPHGTHGDLS